MGETKDLRKYETYLTEKELAESTRKLYLKKAQELLDFLQKRKITKEIIIAYKEYLTRKGLAITTLNLNIVAVNSYLKYAGYSECTVKTRRIQRRKSLDNVISVKEYQILLDYARESGREKYYFIMKTLALTGIRISELSYFTVEILNKEVITVNNKGKTREIYLPDELLKGLSYYCKKMGIERGVIFTGNNKEPISRIGVYKMLTYMAEMTGIPKEKVHPHSFRHLFAITYMKHYSNMFELADILGHSSLETTRIYATSSIKEKRKRINKLGL